MPFEYEQHIKVIVFNLLVFIMDIEYHNETKKAKNSGKNYINFLQEVNK